MPGSPRSPSEPPGRLEAALPPAELGARTGGSPGTAGPARLQAVGGGGRAGAEGPGAHRPPPWPGSRCSGRLSRPDRAGDCRFSFGGWRGGHKSRGPRTALPFPASPRLGPRSLSRHLRRLRHPLYCSPHPRSQPAACTSGRISSPPDPRVPAWVSGPVILGLLEILHAPGPHPWHALSRKQVGSRSARGGPSCPCLGRTFSGLGVLCWGLDARPSEIDASGKIDTAWVWGVSSKGGGGQPFTVEIKKANCSPSNLLQP